MRELVLMIYSLLGTDITGISRCEIGATVFEGTAYWIKTAEPAVDADPMYHSPPPR